MPKVRLLPHPGLCPEGMEMDVKNGDSLCQCLLKVGVEIEHACEMVTACATCHVYVREGGDSLAEPSDDEGDQLDHAWGLDADSRLACCVRLNGVDLTVEFPKHSRNHAREH